MTKSKTKNVSRICFDRKQSGRAHGRKSLGDRIKVGDLHQETGMVSLLDFHSALWPWSGSLGLGFLTCETKGVEQAEWCS